MIVLDRLLIGGIKFVLGKVVAAAETELNDEDHIREEFLAAQMRHELGEIGDEEFAQVEADFLTRLRAIKEEQMGERPAPGEMRVTGAVAEFTADEEHE